jgi:hypothetical protein
MLSDQVQAPDPAEVGTADIETGPFPGAPTPLTCPDCGGALWELARGDLVRYRCHVGHAYTADSMVAAQASTVEGALWSALRTLEEKAELSRRMAERADQRIRQLLLAGRASPPDPVDDDVAQEAGSRLAGAERT